MKFKLRNILLNQKNKKQ